jgi:CelD/BcsL family acetyltransferase involved in cellulose biosynthesis
MREKVRYYRRRAERMGPVEVHEATSETSAEWLDVLFDLHRARWSARGESGGLASPEVQRFQRSAIPAMTASGLARLYGLRIGERRAAAMLVLCDGWAAYYYIGGFDPELADVSPGTILIAHAMERARDEGLAELDFLRGAEPYKYRFGAIDRRLRARRLATRLAQAAGQRDGSCAAGA